MRKCLRCGNDLVSDFNFEVTQSNLGLICELSEMHNLHLEPVATVSAAVCPRCGYVELYTDDLQKINIIKMKREQKKNG